MCLIHCAIVFHLCHCGYKTSYKTHKTTLYPPCIVKTSGSTVVASSVICVVMAISSLLPSVVSSSTSAAVTGDSTSSPCVAARETAALDALLPSSTLYLTSACQRNYMKTQKCTNDYMDDMLMDGNFNKYEMKCWYCTPLVLHCEGRIGPGTAEAR